MFLKKGLRFLLFCILNYITINLSFGQVLDFEQMSVKDGLPSTECYSVIQDKKGYVCVFSEFGIVKNNGERFNPICTNIPLKDQNAYAVFQTAAGEVYFSNSFNKLFVIRNDSAISIKAIEAFTKNFTQSDDIIFQIIVDVNNDIYFSNYKASFRYRKTKNVVETLRSKENKSLIYQAINNDFFSLRSFFFKKESNELLIYDKNDVIKSKIYTESFYESRKLLKVNESYFVCSSDHIYKIDKKGKTISKEIKGIVSFVVDKKSRMWLLTKNGIFLLDEQLNLLANYLNGKIVSDICFDNKDGIWVTTIGEGVYYYKNKEEEVAYSNTNLKCNEIFFIRKNQGAIYFSSIDGGCYKLGSHGIESIYDFKDIVFCGDISKYKDGYLFITKKGVFYKEAYNTIKEIEIGKGILGLYSNLVKVLSDTDYLILGGTAVYYFKNNTFSHTRLIHNKIYCSTPFDKNHYLIGTRKGIYLYNYLTNTVENYNTFFSDKSIMSLIYDNNENLWVATRGDGLYIISKNNKIIKYSNLPFFVVKDIDFFDDDGVVVSTNLGVFVNKYKDTSILEDWLNVFNDEVNAVEFVDKKLWIASRKGLYSLDFSSLKKETDYPVIINSIYADSKKVLENSSVLKYNENDLRFNFDFLNYQSKVENFYFNLDGPTKLSGTISGNVLQIQNLAPGEYKLDVYPYHGSTYNTKHYISKSFTILPAFWQTNWFKLLAFLLIITISGLSVGLFFNRKRKQEMKESEIRKLLAEYKLTALKAQINPHFISNSLSAIQLLIDSGKVDKANQYIAKFSLLIRYVLKYSDKHVSKLSDELKIIELNVELEQLRFSDSFQFKMEIAADVNIMETYVPPLITQPFIENAIWHGLIPLNNGTQPSLHLKVEKNEDILKITIEDNGVGRKVASQTEALGNNKFKESVGSMLTANRLENLNHLYNATVAKVITEDLFDNQSNPVGTRIILFLPISVFNSF